MSDTSHAPHRALPSASAIADAVAQRMAYRGGDGPTAAQLAAEHDKKQTFRRMIDPGILRPNSKEVSMLALKTISTIAENLIREPENPKYQSFKPTNTAIKTRLVEPKGTIEFLIAMGFRPEVDNFQPIYAFNPKRMPDLVLGAAILREALGIEAQKETRASNAKVDQKAIDAEIAHRVKLAYQDDRKSRQDFDEREKQRREAKAAAAAAKALEPVALVPTATSTARRTAPRRRAPPLAGDDDEELEEDEDEDDEEMDEDHNMPGSGNVLGAPTSGSGSSTTGSAMVLD